MSTIARLDASRMAMHRSRKRVNRIALALSLAAMAFGVFWLIWILVETVRLGIGGIALATFTEMTPPPQAETGGLANAIFGSLLMVSLATALGTPIGILAGIYLAEYSQKGWLGSVTRFINDMPFAFYADSLANAFTAADVGLFLAKNGFSGVIIFIIACYQGLLVQQSAHEVPQVTTKAVVDSIIYVTTFNLGMTTLFYLNQLMALGIL